MSKSAPSMNIFALRHPKQVRWNQSGQAWLIDIYDWDIVLVEKDAAAALSFGLTLCVGLFPCSMSIKGSPEGLIHRQESGYISCFSAHGCEQLSIESIQFFCDFDQRNKPRESSFKVQGSNMSIWNSTFTGCVSIEDGGVIQSFDKAIVVVNFSRFYDLHSYKFGGAIAAYGGSVFVFNSTFSNVSASHGGGALWSSGYLSCYGFSQFHKTSLRVIASTFTNCSSEENGGAIFVTRNSDLTLSDPDMSSFVVEIHSTTFSYCKSRSGGAISTSSGVSLDLHGSLIHHNVATGSGGAISANNSAIKFSNSVMNYNEAHGFGGGAMFFNEALIFAKSTSCTGNTAPAGGGGVLLSQGSLPPAPEVIANLCKGENYAMYGPCFASESKSLNFTIISGHAELFWAGLPIKLTVVKLDAYHQIVSADSSSFAQMLPSKSSPSAKEDLNASFSFVGTSINQLMRGSASYEIAIKPTFIKFNADAGEARVQTQPHIFLQGTDIQTGSNLQSEVISIKLEEGRKVCPYGYVLDLDWEMNGQRPMAATCKLCPAEEYSIDPLAASPGSVSRKPSCMTCPAGALCPDGSCAFHHGLSNRVCTGGYLIQGRWEVNNVSKRFELLGCPPGYSAGSEECNVCPAAFYCTGNNVPSRPCLSTSFTPPGANSSTTCKPSVFVTVTVNLPIKRPDFNDFLARQFNKALANATRLNPGYVAIKVVQSGDDPETTTVASDLVVPDAKEAAALVDLFKRGIMTGGMAFDGRLWHNVHLLSVKVTSCIPGYELDLIQQSCELCPANYYCVGGSLGRVACSTVLESSFSPPGSNQTASCTSAVFITLVFSIPLMNVTDDLRSKLIVAISLTAGIPSERVTISFGNARRAEEPPASALVVTAKLAASDAASASTMKGKLDLSSLNTRLVAEGLPQSKSISVTIPETSSYLSGQSLSTSAVIGFSVAAIILLAALSVGAFFLAFKMRAYQRYTEFCAVLKGANAGDTASDRHLPPDLRTIYTSERILSKCLQGSGCVIQAKQTTTDMAVAIKVLIPLVTAFQEKELDQLRREKRALTLFSQRKCEYAARLVLGPDMSELVGISSNVSWFIMDLLRGDRMNNVIYPDKGPHIKGNEVSQIECIRLARDVLAALKLLHEEGMLHLNVNPSNIFRCKTASTTMQGEVFSGEFSYKLTGFGTVSDSKNAGSKSIIAGELAYMPPEMLNEPASANFSTDLWSLGMTMFELITCTLPFQAGTCQDRKAVLPEKMDEEVPNLLDRISPEKRSKYDHSLAALISKVLERNSVRRFSSADEMHDAVFGCLIVHSNAFYSAYLSFREESDEPLAKLLFDELNHSLTPGGHRVAVYSKSTGRDAQEASWNLNEDISEGLLHSICYIPIFSYGATVCFTLAEGGNAQDTTTLGWGGWEESRVLQDEDAKVQEDAVLKEMMVAEALLERSSESIIRLDGEKGRVRSLFPVFASLPQPHGHHANPRMGNDFDALGGGRQFSPLTLHSTGQAAARFLRDRAGLPVEATRRVEERSVAAVLAGLVQLQGCRLWEHSRAVAEESLTKEQLALGGKGSGGFAGPSKNLDDNAPGEEQVNRLQKSPCNHRCDEFHQL
jgi:serine/threonine protein kinase